MTLTERGRGFTLVELLVVVALVSLLLALLTPSLRRSKHLARLAICGSGQKQYVYACGVYAGSQRGFFPRFDGNGCKAGHSRGNNLWDVDYCVYEHLRYRLGVPHEAFFCPFTTTDHAGDDFLTVGWKRYGFALLTYSYWVPRQLNCGLGPPDLDAPGNFRIIDTEPFRGPAGMADEMVSRNAMLTDAIITPDSLGPTAPLSEDSTIHAPTFKLHLYGGRLDRINHAFADGSVRLVEPRDVRARFMGNWWNWK
ncbi:MAG: hypothetical protein BWX88_04399 [Planctomycetes bacterium ADurb.Bin126]|nr:MAG: hypothetical protein BWX88_04399 [Planctomycetes bacterium ADurb.Bin126]HOD81987.1 prepilin-type N-terminal cleavage/methylation domain-containing protein [Phycisphaerae bacterium]HQL74265.1 prepilin-type N-terminal cleavage/methylation domain-containing protein [Phycisphaerae bacterium]